MTPAGPAISFRTGGIPKDGFQFKEFFQASLTPFSAVARLLVASKATAEIDSRVVDVYIARANSFRNPTGVFDVPRGHKA
jgi:hypothetical protein